MSELTDINQTVTCVFTRHLEQCISGELIITVCVFAQIVNNHQIHQLFFHQRLFFSHTSTATTLTHDLSTSQHFTLFQDILLSPSHSLCKSKSLNLYLHPYSLSFKSHLSS